MDSAETELIEALRQNAEDEINRTEDNGAAAAAYGIALSLVRYHLPKIKSEAIRSAVRRLPSTRREVASSR